MSQSVLLHALCFTLLLMMLFSGPIHASSDRVGRCELRGDVVARSHKRSRDDLPRSSGAVLRVDDVMGDHVAHVAATWRCRMDDGHEAGRGIATWAGLVSGRAVTTLTPQIVHVSDTTDLEGIEVTVQDHASGPR